MSNDKIRRFQPPPGAANSHAAPMRPQLAWEILRVLQEVLAAIPAGHEGIDILELGAQLKQEGGFVGFRVLRQTGVPDVAYEAYVQRLAISARQQGLSLHAGNPEMAQRQPAGGLIIPQAALQTAMVQSFTLVPLPWASSRG